MNGDEVLRLLLATPLPDDVFSMATTTVDGVLDDDNLLAVIELPLEYTAEGTLGVGTVTLSFRRTLFTEYETVDAKYGDEDAPETLVSALAHSMCTESHVRLLIIHDSTGSGAPVISREITRD